MSWSHVPAIYRRAGGRRSYNARRQFAATARRVQVVELLARGLTQRAIAERLQVHESTVSRDVARLDAQWRAARR